LYFQEIINNNCQNKATEKIDSKHANSQMEICQNVNLLGVVANAYNSSTEKAKVGGQQL
jgi:hypothetical protein